MKKLFITLVVLPLCMLQVIQAQEVAKDYPVKVLTFGNWADPTIVKYEDTYYMTSNNDNHIPSAMLLKSKDLFDWEPITYTNPNRDQGPATDIAKYGNKLYIYGGGGKDVWVQYAEYPFESWSERINMDPIEPHGIDAGHIADEQGNRYLYTNMGKMLKISKDGLKAETAPQLIYDGWDIPDSIDIECVCLESPKLFKKDEYYFLISAAGGTVGPATSHMAIVARSKTVEGPWENSPYNPMIWTESMNEKWWSKGHATLIEGPDGNWAAIYHGYLQHQRSLGRATLMSPINWTDDGWPVVADEWPEGWDKETVFNWELSDSFDNQELGIQWQAWNDLKPERFSFSDGSLKFKGINTVDPGLSFPITVNPLHSGYEVETEVEISNDGTAGLLLFYNSNAYVGIGLSGDGKIQKYLKLSERMETPKPRDIVEVGVDKIKLKIKNDNQTVSYYYKIEGADWIKLEASEDISGFQDNIYGGFISVRPGLFVLGNSKAIFNKFNYSKL